MEIVNKYDPVTLSKYDIGNGITKNMFGSGLRATVRFKMIATFHTNT